MKGWYRESLKMALGFYKSLNHCPVASSSYRQKERMELWRRLSIALEDWIAFCLYSDMVEKLRESNDKNALDFIDGYLANKEGEE